jgi:hypothetical protein
VNYPFWSELCRVLGIVGSVVAVIGTIGYYAFGRIVDRQKNQRIEQLESGNTALKNQLAETARLAEPTKLEFALTKPFATPRGVGALVYFKASKNEALGRLTFVVNLLDGSPEKILHIFPSLEGGAFTTGDKSEEIAPDGKSARVTYTPMDVVAVIELTISAPSRVRIQGNKLKEPCIVTIPPDT